MSQAHPIIAVTGSSGAGTSSVKTATERIFAAHRIHAAIVEGDSFHRYDREAMQRAVQEAKQHDWSVTHFGPEGNLFEDLEALFRQYANDGSGRARHYVHTDEEATRYGTAAGTFTTWQDLPVNTDLLLYEGLHGALVTDTVNIAQYVDLLVGVVPIINLEWIQKIQRDRTLRGHTPEQVLQSILYRMHDYVHYIVPQFSRTDINFQRVPMLDTSNPFIAASIPSNEVSVVIIHIANPQKITVDIARILRQIDGGFAARVPNTLVIPATEKIRAMELILGPTVERILAQRRLTR